MRHDTSLYGKRLKYLNSYFLFCSVLLVESLYTNANILIYFVRCYICFLFLSVVVIQSRLAFRIVFTTPGCWQPVCFRQHGCMCEETDTTLNVFTSFFMLWSLFITMHERLLPASPNWYCSRCSDVSVNGVFGFGAKNVIHLLQVTATSPSVIGEGFYIIFLDLTLDLIWSGHLPAGELIGHTERVSGFAFCHHNGQEHICASTSDDKTVKIWDAEQRVLVTEHNVHQVNEVSSHWNILMSP